MDSVYYSLPKFLFLSVNTFFSPCHAGTCTWFSFLKKKNKNKKNICLFIPVSIFVAFVGSKEDPQTLGPVSNRCGTHCCSLFFSLTLEFESGSFSWTWVHAFFVFEAFHFSFFFFFSFNYKGKYIGEALQVSSEIDFKFSPFWLKPCSICKH